MQEKNGRKKAKDQLKVLMRKTQWNRAETKNAMNLLKLFHENYTGMQQKLHNISSTTAR